ncbi:MAG: hypothetical protein AB1801_16975 [Chloroflexota bacterium]
MIISQHWGAVGLAVLSLLLPMGSVWLKDSSRQRVKERWSGSAVQFFYFAGLPYLALVSGILTPKLLGLKGLEYFAMIDAGGPLLAVPPALISMLAGWLIDAPTTILAGIMVSAGWGGLWYTLIRAGVKPAGDFRMAGLDIIYLSLHWAFYRAIFWQITDDLYLGVILGAGLVILEWVLLAWVQKSWPACQKSILSRSALVILTGVVFFYSPNLWLLWPVHLALVKIVRSNVVTAPNRDIMIWDRSPIRIQENHAGTTQSLKPHQ